MLCRAATTNNTNNTNYSNYNNIGKLLAGNWRGEFEPQIGHSVSASNLIK